MTKVIVINGCLRMEKSNTSKILTPFLEGMKQAKADIEMFYIKHLNIQPCKGDFYCWNKKPGKCHIADDMQLLYPKLRDAHVLVFVTAVYVPLPGEMQNIFNRIIPLINPVITTRNGRTRARFHTDVKIKKMVLVSSSAWWEKENFETVIRIVKELAEDVSVEFAGALVRPHVDWLTKNDEKVKEIYNTAKQLGFQLIREGKMSKNRLKIICQPLVSNKRFLSEMN